MATEKCKYCGSVLLSTSACSNVFCPGMGLAPLNIEATSDSRSLTDLERVKNDGHELQYVKE